MLDSQANWLNVSAATAGQWLNGSAGTAGVFAATATANVSVSGVCVPRRTAASVWEPSLRELEPSVLEPSKRGWSVWQPHVWQPEAAVAEP